MSPTASQGSRAETYEPMYLRTIGGGAMAVCGCGGSARSSHSSSRVRFQCYRCGRTWSATPVDVRRAALSSEDR